MNPALVTGRCHSRCPRDMVQSLPSTIPSSLHSQSVKTTGMTRSIHAELTPPRVASHTKLLHSWKLSITHSCSVGSGAVSPNRYQPLLKTTTAYCARDWLFWSIVASFLISIVRYYQHCATDTKKENRNETYHLEPRVFKIAVNKDNNFGKTLFQSVLGKTTLCGRHWYSFQ